MFRTQLYRIRVLVPLQVVSENEKEDAIPTLFRTRSDIGFAYTLIRHSC